LRDNRKTELVKSILYWIVSDIRYLHNATGLFQQDLDEMARHRRIIRGKSNEELNTTAHISNSSYRKRLYEAYDAGPDFEVAVIDAIKAHQERLEAMEITELQAELNMLIQNNKDTKEAERPFNSQDNALTRLSFWVRKSVWSPEEALLIFAKREPKSEVIAYLRNMGDAEREESPFATAFFITMELAKSAIEAGEISALGRPLEYLLWYEKMLQDVDGDIRTAILEIHDPDRFHALQYGVPENATDLSDLEQRSLLKIVAAMAVQGYRFKPSAARNEATSDIQSDAALLGLELDQKTILKWLRKACELIPEDTT